MAVWALVTRLECWLLPDVTSPFRVVVFGPEGARALPRCSPLATASAARLAPLAIAPWLTTPAWFGAR